MVPLLFGIAAVLSATPLWWRGFRSVPLSRRLLAALVTLSATVTAALGGAHLVAVLAALPRKTYDFRAYSLILLGVLLVAPAIVCIAMVPGLVRSERRAHQIALAAFGALLAINLPLIPLQGFAVGLSVAAGIGVASLALLGRGTRARTTVTRSAVE